MELCHAVLNSLPPGPKLEHWSLNNGVRCVEALMPDASLTCLDLWCRAGSSWERSREEGLAHFLEHMVFKGSHQLQAGAFDREIEALGGSSNAATGFDDVHFHVLIPADQATKALDLLLDLVLRPSLTEDAFALERDVVLEEIAQYADQPDEQVLQQLLSRACPNHAYGRPILGKPPSLLAMTPTAMRDFHARRYRGSNCCLAIAGPPLEGLRHRVGMSVLAELPDASATAATPQKAAVVPGCHSIRVARLESARLLMLWSIAPASDQTTVMGADLATTVLGEGRRSRLVCELREQLQIVETVDMDLTVLERGGLVSLELCCSEENLPRAEQAVREQLKRVADEPIERWELERSKRLVENGLRFALESAAQVAGIAANQTLWDRPQALLDEQLEVALEPRLAREGAERVEDEARLTEHAGVRSEELKHVPRIRRRIKY